jgi:hypothetical protein
MLLCAAVPRPPGGLAYGRERRRRMLIALKWVKRLMRGGFSPLDPPRRRLPEQKACPPACLRSSSLMVGWSIEVPKRNDARPRRQKDTSISRNRVWEMKSSRISGEARSRVAATSLPRTCRYT